MCQHNHFASQVMLAYGYMAFLPLAKTHTLCFWQCGFITVNFRKYIEIDKNTIKFLHFLPTTQRLCLASGKNGSTPYLLIDKLIA